MVLRPMSVHHLYQLAPNMAVNQYETFLLHLDLRNVTSVCPQCSGLMKLWWNGWGTMRFMCTTNTSVCRRVEKIDWPRTWL